ncbi:MAG TPA: DNA methyltransferase [Methylosinus sp.]|uniref:Eco57I restriction-modification methylase domain-containing protein n=1 Tax=Methylosinus sp. TaxID=427 RepID=UPI002F95ED45
MTYQARPDETVEWLNYLQPEGLVVGPNILRERGLNPIRQTPLDTEDAARALGLPTDARREDDRLFELDDAWRFFETVLEWSAKLVAGAPGGPPIPPELTVTVPEHETLLAPDMVVLWKGDAPEGVPAQALVMLHPSLEADDRNQFPSSEWEASPHQRLERLLRETNVGVGLLVARNTLRLVYAPRGETAGWLSWPLAPLGRVEGRPMLAGLKLCLGRSAFFSGAPETRLRALLEASRAAQNEVSEKLSGQVLGALHELLRGLHRAAPERIEALAESNPQHLYEGLLTCLMRLVFLLYAEDRDLLPSSPDPSLRQLWEKGYSIKTLYMRLLTDEALNPDTMDDRRGGWGQLLAVFRLIHAGYPGWVTGRGGKLFDPEGFPFLEGREKGQGREDATVLPVSDGCILRILHGLMTIEGRSLSNEKIRERLSYRSLDVESIGSVYETVMGFTTDRARERMIALKDEKKLPTFIGLDTLLAQKPADRQKWLKEKSIKLSAKQAKAVKEAGDVAALVEAFGTLVDERASPKATPIGPGAPFLQPTEERRRSGSHYTPRSLTEPIVRHALEPAFERIGERASPEAVLSLKILDPACGSGAFLVEACRQLGQRLEQAWNMYGAEKPIVPPDEDEALHARRLVAQKCLYGVDRNPMAVDLARLSLWLATLARDHEFTFLDHALKSGDSLVGLTHDEIAAAHWDASKPGLPLFRDAIKKAVEGALEGREAIRNAGDDVRIEAQAARYSRVLDASEPARIVGDAVIAAFFSADKPRGREAERQKVESWIAGSLTPDWDRLHRKGEALRAEEGWRPFHWEIEFPEVFARENPGFDAIVGNPPFAGKNTISAASGPRYLPWLQTLHEGAHGNADLVAHFFRRAFGLLREGGAFGLIATNTIGQGDTRDTGLAAILRAGGAIYRAIKRYQWPNEGAAVVVSIVHVHKGEEARAPILNGRVVARISAYLVVGDLDDAPARLSANSGKAFQGSILLGKGFTFDNTAAAKGETESIGEMERLIAGDQHNRTCIMPLIGGEEVTTSPTHAHHRYAIDFFDRPLRKDPGLLSWFSSNDAEKTKCLREGVVPNDYPYSVAEDWPDLIEIILRRVKPIRDLQTRDALRERWWQYAEKRPGLYTKIAGLEHVIVVSSKATPHHAFAFLPTGFIYSQNLNVLAIESFGLFAVLQSRAHEVWARFVGTTLEDRLTYVKDDCFETFPFPSSYEARAWIEAAGRAYHDHRAALMIAANEGMTKTYNRFHKSDERGEPIRRLRELHDEMDRAVLRAYGWDDLAEELRPQFLTEETEDDHTYQNRYFWPAEQRDRVLARLLALNAERHAEEVAAGLAPERAARRSAEEADEAQDALDLS